MSKIGNLDMTFQDTWETRSARLKELGMTYQQFLSSDLWKASKEKTNKRHNYLNCLVCGATDNLHMHHTSYKWLGTHRELSCVIPVCAVHHSVIHTLAQETGLSVRLVSNYLTSSQESKSTIEDIKRVNQDALEILRKNRTVALYATD